jgi:hypothetical protein
MGHCTRYFENLHAVIHSVNHPFEMVWHRWIMFLMSKDIRSTYGIFSSRPTCHTATMAIKFHEFQRGKTHIQTTAFDSLSPPNSCFSHNAQYNHSTPRVPKALTCSSPSSKVQSPTLSMHSENKLSTSKLWWQCYQTQGEFSSETKGKLGQSALSYLLLKIQYSKLGEVAPWEAEIKRLQFEASTGKRSVRSQLNQQKDRHVDICL